MPPDLGPSFALSDVLTIVGMLVMILLQSFAFHRWLTQQFEERDDALNKAVLARNHELSKMEGRIDAVREHSRGEIARVDRDMAGLRERLAQMPSRKDLEDVIRERVAPVEHDLRQLVIELARIGVHEAAPVRHGKQSWDP